MELIYLDSIGDIGYLVMMVLALFRRCVWVLIDLEILFCEFMEFQHSLISKLEFTNMVHNISRIIYPCFQVDSKAILSFLLLHSKNSLYLLDLIISLY